MTAALGNHETLRLRTIIAANVRRERTARQMTQIALSEAAGYSSPVVSLIEGGDLANQTASLPALARIAHALGVPPCTLLMTETERRAWCAAMDGTQKYSHAR